MNLMYFDRAPCAMKVACTVLSGGKDGDNIKLLPIAIVASGRFGACARKGDIINLPMAR